VLPERGSPTRDPGPREFPRRSAPFLALLAGHAEGGSRERLQARLSDRLAAGLADAVGAVLDLGQHPLGLGQQLAGVLGQGELVLTLERLGPRVGGVVAGVTNRIAEPGRDLGFRGGDILAQPAGLVLKFPPDPGELLLGPRLLARPDRQSRGTRA